MSQAERDVATSGPERLETLRVLIAQNLPGGRPESVARLAAAARIHVASTGELMFRQGESVQLTLVLSGLAAFRRTTLEGQQLTVGLAYPGELRGIASAASVIASVDMVALTETEFATWDGRHLREAIRGDADLALEVVDRLASFLNTVTENLDGFVHQDARRRVTRVLARHLDLWQADPPVLSRAHLPGLVGTSREMTGRVLRELEREGTVARVGRKGLRILRPERLEASPRP